MASFTNKFTLYLNLGHQCLTCFKVFVILKCPLVKYIMTFQEYNFTKRVHLKYHDYILVLSKVIFLNTKYSKLTGFFNRGSKAYLAMILKKSLLNSRGFFWVLAILIGSPFQYMHLLVVWCNFEALLVNRLNWHWPLLHWVPTQGIEMVISHFFLSRRYSHWKSKAWSKVI